MKGSLDAHFTRGHAGHTENRPKHGARRRRTKYKNWPSQQPQYTMHPNPTQALAIYQGPVAPAMIPGINMGPPDMRIFEQAIGSHFGNEGGAAITPQQIYSLLTVSPAFRGAFSSVWQGLTKSLVDVRNLLHHEMIIGARNTFSVKQVVNYNEKNVSDVIAAKLQSGISGRLPDTQLNGRLLEKVTKMLWEKLSTAVSSAENERSPVQKMTRVDISSTSRICENITASSGANAVLSIIEGSLTFEVRRGEFFDIVKPKRIEIGLELCFKVVFINGGTLALLDQDHEFQEFVQTSENRYFNQICYR